MNVVLNIFIIAAIGYLLGSIKIKNIMLGTAGVLIIAMIFGHFGAEVPTDVRNFGLVLFITAVGFNAGPKFFRDFKKNAKSYIILGFLIILSGSLVCVIIIKVFNVSSELCVGLMTGALTSTPGLAAAQEAAGENAALATTGYAIAYPFGIVGVVLFIQVIPKVLKINIPEERKKLTSAYEKKPTDIPKKLYKFDGAGFLAFVTAVVFGILIGFINIPLPGGSNFSLGAAGGPLLTGLLIGHFGHFGPFDFTVPKNTLNAFRELGLMLFLIGAGIDGGKGFVEVLQEQGAMLFVYGAAITTVPMILGYIIAAKILHLSIFNNLGSITGGMTSTPALGSLISLAKTDDVATSYAATYPISLILIVLCSQFIVLLF